MTACMWVSQNKVPQNKGLYLLWCLTLSNTHNERVNVSKDKNTPAEIKGKSRNFKNDCQEHDKRSTSAMSD